MVLLDVLRDPLAVPILLIAIIIILGLCLSVLNNIDRILVGLANKSLSYAQMKELFELVRKISNNV